MASLVVREEPLLKQLVRSRTLHSSARASSSNRSSSQPPPISRAATTSNNMSPPTSGSGPQVTYTLQFLPYNVVYPKKKHSLSVSQPDLSKFYSQSPPIYSPPRTTGVSRDTSPIRSLGGGSISASLRNSLINLESAAWPSLASNSVLLPMTDAIPSTLVQPPNEINKSNNFILDANNNDSNNNNCISKSNISDLDLQIKNTSSSPGFCQMCFLLNKPRIVQNGSTAQDTTCNSCLNPSNLSMTASILNNPNFCAVGSAKPSDSSVYVNGCEIQNSYGNRGYTTNSNNNQFGDMYHQQQTQIQQQGNFQYNHHQQYPQGSRYLSRPESTGPYNNNINNYPPSSSGLSRYTSRGVSPVKERPPAHPSTNTTDGTNHSLFASFYSASGTNQGAIDNRIEQAMDLVKSHLMNAVRSEVEELKERIVKLEDVISHLQTENDFLKANVSQEVLTQLPPPTSSHHQILQQGPQVPQSISGHTPGNNPQGGLSPTSSPLVVTTQHQQQL